MRCWRHTHEEDQGPCRAEAYSPQGRQRASVRLLSIPRTLRGPSSCGTFPSVALPVHSHPSSSPRAMSDPKALCSHTALEHHRTDPSGSSHALRHVAAYCLNCTLDAKAVRVETQLISASCCIPGTSDTATVSMTEWSVAVREIS